ncbi:MAG TPA: response regulator [Pirellulales bacterium]|nr:response regulator [Pirellulales bacterium]
MTTKILVVDDSLVERLLVKGILGRDPSFRIELAENGQEALEKIAESPPDLVVTDLVMPRLNGLELVRAVRLRDPTIPVILMTAYGDESTAVQALEAGAASYVPKAQRAERLIETVRRVAEVAAADRCRQRLSQCLLVYHCRFSLDNDPDLIRELGRLVRQIMAGVGFASLVERIRVGEALEEALLSAMYQGNLEIDEQELAKVRRELDDFFIQRLLEERRREPRIRERRIGVNVRILANEATFKICDQGRGFGALLGGDDDMEQFEAGYKRGRTLIHALMDEVGYDEANHELRMSKFVAETESSHAGA